MCDKIFITPDSVEWDPYSDYFAANEAAMLDCDGTLINPNDRYPHTRAQLVESYLNLPSIDTVNATMDEVIATGIDNCELMYQPPRIQDNRSLPNHKANNFADDLLNNTLQGNISAAFGETRIKET